MPDFIIVGSDGTEHHFPDGMDPQRAIQTVRNSELKSANAKPLKEPTTYNGGFLKGFNEHLTDVGNSAFESAAHPQTAGDFLGLLLPTSMGAGGATVRGLKTVSDAEPVGNKAVRGAARLGAHALDLTPNIVKSELEQKGINALRKFGEPPPPRWLESPQEALARRTVQPTDIQRRLSPPTQTERVPYGGVEVPRRVKRTRMSTEVANPFGKDEEGSLLDELTQKLGGQGTEDAAPVSSASSVAEGSAAPETLEEALGIKPKLSAPEVAAGLRREYGSRDASRMLYGSGGSVLPRPEAIEAIKRLAPGPSRLPLAAEARINAVPREMTLEDALREIINMKRDE